MLFSLLQTPEAIQAAGEVVGLLGILFAVTIIVVISYLVHRNTKLSK